MPLLSVEGSIGAGKTTFLAVLESMGHRVIYEPVDEWSTETIGGCSMLEHYYKDKSKYGFAFQMYVLQSRVKRMNDVISQHPNAVIITERCPLTDYHVFATMMHQRGIIDDYSFHVYKRWFEFMKGVIPPIDGVVYLRVSPETCVKRIVQRARQGEGLIDLGYLHDLHTRHETWLMNEEKTVPICVIDGDGDVPVGTAIDAFLARLGV
jgi:deoxyadenosine/deoxycytidine kinase